VTTTYEVIFEGSNHTICGEYTTAAEALETVADLRRSGLSADLIKVAKVTREFVGLPDLRAEAESAERNLVTCEYFALCVNEADGTVTHPILGQVPTCRRCAEKMEKVLHLWPEAVGT
jgi:hypothetical protein